MGMVQMPSGIVLSPHAIDLAQRSAMAAAKKLERLFLQYPEISRDDLLQHGTMRCYAEVGGYDASRSSWSNYCYHCAYRRMLDMLRARKHRNSEDQIPDNAELAGHIAVRPLVINLENLKAAAETCPRPFAGRRGRPWKEPLAVRLDMWERRRRGESYGQIALRHGVKRFRVQDCVESVGKFLSTVEGAE